MNWGGRTQRGCANTSRGARFANPSSPILRRRRGLLRLCPRPGTVRRFRGNTRPAHRGRIACANTVVAARQTAGMVGGHRADGFAPRAGAGDRCRNAFSGGDSDRFGADRAQCDAGCRADCAGECRPRGNRRKPCRVRPDPVRTVERTPHVCRRTTFGRPGTIA